MEYMKKWNENHVQKENKDANEESLQITDTFLVSGSSNQPDEQEKIKAEDDHQDPLNEDQEIEKVLLIGRGAVGTVMGDLLHGKLKENFAFGASGERKERYEKSPFLVNGKETVYPYVSGPDDPGENGKPFGKADLILIATKYGALEEAMELAAPFVSDKTVFMPCINGIVSEEDLRRRFADNLTLRTIAQKMDATYLDGKVEYTQKGELVYGGDEASQADAVKRIAALFDRCGVPYIVSDDILYDQWNKLMLNCGINQVCAAFDMSYGEVLDEPETNAMLRTAMDEVRQTANAMGIALTEQNVEDWMDAVARLDYHSMPSMLQDVRSHRKTEEQLFSATIIPLAEKLGVDVPVLRDLKKRIDRIDEFNACNI